MSPRTRRSIWTLATVRWGLCYLSVLERRQVGRVIDRLAEVPVPPGAERVPGTRRLYRVSCGEARILYVIEADRILVVSVALGARDLPVRFRRRHAPAD